MARRIDAVRRRVREDRADPSLVGPVDPYDIRQHNLDALKGAQQKPEIWNQVMEYHGFTWYEPSELDRLVGPMRVIPSSLKGLVDARGLEIRNSSLYQHQRHKVGQWRRDRPHPIPLAYTIEDLCALFQTPEAFDGWIKDHESKIRLGKLGIVVTK
jgi:hypothetical protein